MKKDSGGFQGFMLNNFEKIALGVFGALVLVFLVFATVLGSYYDREASELDQLVTQKANAVRDAQPANFEGLKGLEVTPYDQKLLAAPGPRDPRPEVPRTNGGIIDPTTPDLAKRPEPEIFGIRDLKGFGVREVLAIYGTVGGDSRAGGPGANRGVGSSDGGDGGASSSLTLSGSGDDPDGGDDDPPAEPGSALPATGYRPPGDSKTEVKSFITLIGTLPNAEQYKEFIAKTHNTLPPGATTPRYVAFMVERRTQGGSERWESLDVEQVREMIDEVRNQWVSDIADVVDVNHIIAMNTDGYDSNQQKVDYFGFVLQVPPAVGRVWGDEMTSDSIKSLTSGPVYRPLDDVLGEWQTARGASSVNFLANQDAYDSQPEGGLMAVIDRRQQLNLTAGAEADRIVLTTPDADPFQEGISFKVIDDGTGTEAVLNPKIGELSRSGDVILKHPDQAWYELYRKNVDDELERTVILFLDGSDMATEAVVFQQNLRDFQARQGFGSSNNAPENNSTANAAPQAPQGPMDFLFRFHDTSIESGRVYQYRIKLVLENPNFRVNPGYLDETADSQDPWLESEWSEPTDWISVTSYADLVVGPARPAKPGSDPAVSVFLREPSTDDTPLKHEDAVAMLLAQMDKKRGHWMNYVVDNPAPIDVVLNAPAELEMNDETPARFKYTHRYRTDELILDIRGGENFGKLKVPGETLVLDANGNLVVKSELDSGYATALSQYELANKKEERNADPQTGGGGDDGAGGELPPGGGDSGGGE